MSNKSSQLTSSARGSNGSAAVRTDPALNQLRRAVKGQVITSGEPGYDTARQTFYGGMDRRPVAIVRVANDNDVAQVVSLARDVGIELAVRSGGHSAAGHSVSHGGIVLDLADMKALDINPRARTAWAETGLTTGEYTAAADAHGLATGFGDTASVGIGGIALGGGVGYLVRKYGLTVDSLLAADVVTADGQLRRVDAENDPDLFWAIRGGGGNFGVATRFQFRLHDVAHVVGGMLMLPATPSLIQRFIAEGQAAPEELSFIANVMPAPPMPFVPAEHHGKLIIMALVAYVGEAEAAQRALAPLRTLTTPIVDMVRPIQYREMFPPEEGDYHPIASARTLFMDSIDQGTAEGIVEHLAASNAQMAVTQIRVLGGAMARIPVEATAFAHRQRRIMVNVAAVYPDPGEAAQHDAWVDRFAAYLDPDGRGAYVNFLGDEGADRVRQAYPGPTWDRLVAVKSRYDPDNLFRLNQNIPPANS